MSKEKYLYGNNFYYIKSICSLARAKKVKKLTLMIKFLKKKKKSHNQVGYVKLNYI